MQDDYVEYYPEDLPMPPQPMPGEKSDSIYSGLMTQKKIENILQQINPENLIVEIEHRIKGYRKDEYTQQWVQITKDQKPISEELISNFITFLASFLNNNTSMTNLSEKEINKIMYAVIEYIVDDLQTNGERYKLGYNRKVKIYNRMKDKYYFVDKFVPDYSEWSRIALIIESSVFFTLKRALNGSEARRILSSLSIGEQYRGNQQPSKGGILEFWK